MSILELTVTTVVIALLDVFVLSYRWARGVVGYAEAASLPQARVRSGRRHAGFAGEPVWIRPLQASILAFAVTGATLAGLCLAGFLATLIWGG